LESYTKVLLKISIFINLTLVTQGSLLAAKRQLDQVGRVSRARFVLTLDRLVASVATERAPVMVGEEAEAKRLPHPQLWHGERQS
jgi:regulator of sigma D